MTALDPLPAPRLGRYRHYKGGEYELVGVARHSETLEPMALYRPLYNATGLWVRPYGMFFEDVVVDGQTRPRFEPIADAALPDFPDHFETRDLLVRAPRAGDGAVVHAAVTASLAALRAWPASLPWALDEPSVQKSEDWCRQGQAAFAARKDLPMLVFLKGSDVLVGATGLHRMQWSVPKFELGYWGDVRQRGRGLMTQAVEGLVRFAFERLGARRLECLTDEDNRASKRLAKRAGFELEGILRHERAAPDGTLRNTCVYAIVR